jgi:thiamine-monophosphate kinase
MHEARLSDLGERLILQEIIPKYARGTGDDCAVIPVGDGFLVATTDPVPIPAAHAIAGETDPYWMGWLLVTINASDIAASGATPSAFLAAFDMPRDWPVAQLERLMQGIKDSCVANKICYVGGNIREAEKLSAVGFGLGFSKIKPLTRSGANCGDRLFVFGRSGVFWSDVLEFRSGRSVDQVTSPLFRPVSQVGVIHDLHSLGLISCAMDTSDGLAPTLEELAKKNELGILVDTTKIRDASGHLTSLERPERLWMGWGDWTVVAVVKGDACDSVREFCIRKGYSSCEIGELSNDFDGVVLLDGDSSLRLGRLESERFAKDSWFQIGVGAYEKMLRGLALP